MRNDFVDFNWVQLRGILLVWRKTVFGGILFVLHEIASVESCVRHLFVNLFVEDLLKS